MNSRKAYAKINLRLRVLAQEVSGYHSIETIFQRIALHDIVRVELSKERSIRMSGPAMPQGGVGEDADNLAFRAAEEFMRLTGLDDGFRIAIDKHIPVGGGLGGGSADAAAVLLVLQENAPVRLEAGGLIEIAARLGSDVPFMLGGVPLALAWGHGQRMLSIGPLDVRAVHLYAFSNGISSRDAYLTLARSREGRHQQEAALLDAKSLSSWAYMRHAAMNDFEEVVGSLHSAADETLALLRSQSDEEDIVLLSGSGATCFRIPANDGRVIEPPEGVRVIVTSTLG